VVAPVCFGSFLFFLAKTITDQIRAYLERDLSDDINAPPIAIAAVGAAAAQAHILDEEDEEDIGVAAVQPVLAAEDEEDMGAAANQPVLAAEVEEDWGAGVIQSVFAAGGQAGLDAAANQPVLAAEEVAALKGTGEIEEEEEINPDDFEEKDLEDLNYVARFNERYVEERYEEEEEENVLAAVREIMSYFEDNESAEEDEDEIEVDLSEVPPSWIIVFRAWVFGLEESMGEALEGVPEDI
jgi:hypothetical protein